MEAYLLSCNYKLLARNYFVYMLGEIDLIAERNGEIYVIEVKGRRGVNLFVGLEGLVPADKLGKLIKTSSIFIDKNDLNNKICNIVLAFVQINENPIYNKLVFKRLK